MPKHAGEMAKHIKQSKPMKMPKGMGMMDMGKDMPKKKMGKK